MMMSPFIIFAIVLTIAYVLYYATIITMDLNAKSKKEGELEETISAVDGKETDEEYTPQTVVENTETGGFSFLDVPENEEENVPEEEKTDEEEEHSDVLSNASESELNQEFGKESEIQESASDEQEANSSSETAEKQANEEEKPHVDENPEENPIPVVDFSEEPEPVTVSEEPFDESKVFDADLAQPQYAVSSIIGDKTDKILAQRIETIEQKLHSCQAEGKLINPFEFANEAKGDREKSNIDFKDEYTQF